jgi:hypothetical protein
VEKKREEEVRRGKVGGRWQGCGGAERSEQKEERTTKGRDHECTHTYNHYECRNCKRDVVGVEADAIESIAQISFVGRTGPYFGLARRISRRTCSRQFPNCIASCGARRMVS